MSTVSEVGLLTELARLVREERHVSAHRRRLHDRIASFPTPEHEQAEREVSLQRRDLHRQIDAVHADIEAIRAEIPAPLLRDSVSVPLHLGQTPPRADVRGSGRGSRLRSRHPR